MTLLFSTAARSKKHNHLFSPLKCCKGLKGHFASQGEKQQNNTPDCI